MIPPVNDPPDSSHTGIPCDAPVQIGSDLDDLMVGGPDNDVTAGVAGNDALYGGQGNDELDGGPGNDELHGQDGNDVLHGGPGNDFLAGDGGHNVLRGGAGADVYVVGALQGQDLIDNAAGGAALGDADMILFAYALPPAKVSLLREGDDLMIRVPLTGSSARVMGYFLEDGATPHAINQFRFYDGTIWNAAAVRARVLAGSPGDDHLIGYATADKIEGGGGNDVIEGRDGHDTLCGGDGDDVIDGGGGHDVLDGGPGNDRLTGGAGSDYYHFARGSGHDIIISDGNAAGDADCIHFGENIEEDQLWFRRAGDDLSISLIGSADRLDVKDWFAGAAADFTSFALASDKVITPDRVDDLVSAMAGMDMPSGAAAESIAPAQFQLAALVARSWDGKPGAT